MVQYTVKEVIWIPICFSIHVLNSSLLGIISWGLTKKTTTLSTHSSNDSECRTYCLRQRQSQSLPVYLCISICGISSEVRNCNYKSGVCTKHSIELGN